MKQFNIVIGQILERIKKSSTIYLKKIEIDILS
jgi:hypothetical protein